MTEIKMKRIGLRLVVISVISLAVFLSIRKQYNTAQSMLQQNVVVGPASLKDGAVEQSVEGTVDFAANEVDNFQRTGWTKSRLDESVAKFEIDLVNDQKSKNNDGDVGQEEEEVAFYETEQDRETLVDSNVDSLQPEGELGDDENVNPTEDIAKAYTDLVRSEYENENVFRTQTEMLPEDSHLEMLVEVENTDDDNGENDNGDGDGDGVRPNVVEIYITPLPNNDAAETDGDVGINEEDVEDIINEYDEYTDEPRQSTNVVRHVTTDFTPTEVTFSPFQDKIDSPDHQERTYATVTTKMKESLAVSGQHLKGQAKDLTNVVQMSHVAPEPEPPIAPASLLPADARVLQETLTQGLLSSILGNQLSPRMVRYLRYRILASLQKSRNEDVPVSPADANTFISAPTPQVDIVNHGVTQHPMTVSYEIRQLKLNNLAANDINNAEVKITFLNNETAASVRGDQWHPPSYTSTTPRANVYDNPRPLSDADYTSLRTRTNPQPRVSSQATLQSDSAGDTSSGSPLEHAMPLSHGVHQDTNNRIVFSSKFLTTPSWMKPGTHNEQTIINEKSFPESKTVNPLKEVLRQPHQSDLFPNTKEETFNRIDVGNFQKNTSDQNEQFEEYQMDREDFRSLQDPRGDHVLYRQLKSQGQEGELQLLQEHNDPGEPGHSYQDILLQQRVQFDLPVLGMPSDDVLTPLEAKDVRRFPSRVEACPREVKLGDRPHAITALVSFPGDDTKWMRQILEQLFGETTDSLYDITADLQAGNASRVYEMSKRVAIQTHSALDRNFERALVVIRNPYSVEERHQIFRPDYIDWQKQFLWGETYFSWLSSDLPLYVIVYEDMVESPLTELIKLADFLRNDDFRVNYQCAMSVAQKPPNMVSDLREITGIYFKERRNINENIDKVLQVAKSKFPELIPRLESYKV